MDSRGFNVTRDTVISRGPTTITAIESGSFGGKGKRYQRTIAATRQPFPIVITRGTNGIVVHIKKWCCTKLLSVWICIYMHHVLTATREKRCQNATLSPPTPGRPHDTLCTRLFTPSDTCPNFAWDMNVYTYGHHSSTRGKHPLFFTLNFKLWFRFVPGCYSTRSIYPSSLTLPPKVHKYYPEVEVVSSPALARQGYPEGYISRHHSWIHRWPEIGRKQEDVSVYYYSAN